MLIGLLLSFLVVRYTQFYSCGVRQICGDNRIPICGYLKFTVQESVCLYVNPNTYSPRKKQSTASTTTKYVLNLQDGEHGGYVPTLSPACPVVSRLRKSATTNASR